MTQQLVNRMIIPKVHELEKVDRNALFVVNNES